MTYPVVARLPLSRQRAVKCWHAGQTPPKSVYLAESRAESTAARRVKWRLFNIAASVGNAVGRKNTPNGGLELTLQHDLLPAHWCAQVTQPIVRRCDPLLPHARGEMSGVHHLLPAELHPGVRGTHRFGPSNG